MELDFLLLSRTYDLILILLLFFYSLVESCRKLMCTGAVNEKMVYDAVEKLMAELIQKGLLIR
ncbi:MAG: hypothetical protein QXU43_05325 [Thermoproteota archaeon]